MNNGALGINHIDRIPLMCIIYLICFKEFPKSLSQPTVIWPYNLAYNQTTNLFYLITLIKKISASWVSSPWMTVDRKLFLIHFTSVDHPVPWSYRVLFFNSLSAKNHWNPYLFIFLWTCTDGKIRISSNKIYFYMAIYDWFQGDYVDSNTDWAPCRSPEIVTSYDPM